jgi:hypothetical protein
MTSALTKSHASGVPEECGDVDEDRVEQRREFIGAGMQNVEVLLERGVSRLIHPVADAAHQRRALVAGEVEAAGSRI